MGSVVHGSQSADAPCHAARVKVPNLGEECCCAACASPDYRGAYICFIQHLLSGLCKGRPSFQAIRTRLRLTHYLVKSNSAVSGRT